MRPSADRCASSRRGPFAKSSSSRKCSGAAGGAASPKAGSSPSVARASPGPRAARYRFGRQKRRTGRCHTRALGREPRHRERPEKLPHHARRAICGTRHRAKARDPSRGARDGEARRNGERHPERPHALHRMGPRRRDGVPRKARRSGRREGTLLRPALSLAEGNQRERERPHPQSLPEGNGLQERHG